MEMDWQFYFKGKELKYSSFEYLITKIKEENLQKIKNKLQKYLNYKFEIEYLNFDLNLLTTNNDLKLIRPNKFIEKTKRQMKIDFKVYNNNFLFENVKNLFNKIQNYKSIDQYYDEFDKINLRRFFHYYIPSSILNNNIVNYLQQNNNKINCIYLLHGTRETSLNQELLQQQVNEQNNSEECFSWIDLSEKEQFILILPQSLGFCKEYGDEEKFINFVWNNNGCDLKYIERIVMEYVPKLLQRELQCNDLQFNNFVVGFSNGGLFVSDIMINNCNLFKGYCNFMGGLERDEGLEKKQMEVVYPPLKIVTGSLDDNLELCLEAKEYFMEKCVAFQFEEIPKQHHMYLQEKTVEIYNFFIQLNSKQLHH